jgi:hypothetical protein
MDYKYIVLRQYRDAPLLAYRFAYIGIDNRLVDLGVFVMETISFIEMLLTMMLGAKAVGSKIEVEFLNGESWKTLVSRL